VVERLLYGKRQNFHKELGGQKKKKSRVEECPGGQRLHLEALLRLGGKPGGDVLGNRMGGGGESRGSDHLLHVKK